MTLDPARPDLRPTGPVSEAEHAGLARALETFSQRVERDDFSAFERFLEGFPNGGWSRGVRLRLAEEYYDSLWYSKALAMLEQLWAERGSSPGSAAAVFSTHAGVQLIELYARLGRWEDVQALEGLLGKAILAKEDVETLRGVQQGLATMRTYPEVSFRCGALALERVRVYQHATNAGHALLLNSRSSPQGMNLAEVGDLAQRMGMNFQVAFREAGAARVTPAVAHLKIGHFVAVLRDFQGRLRVEDPTGWQTIWASPAALDAEASGYFLVPTGPLPVGWRKVEAAEAATVWGRNGVLDNDPDGSGRRDRKARCGGGQGGSPFGMASWEVHLMLVSQQIVDTPLRYEPPVGPGVEFTFRHTQRANRRFGFRPTWTHNWMGQFYENPRVPLGDIWLHEEGGWERFVPLDDEGKEYQGRVFNTGRVRRADAKTLVWTFPDGTSRTYTTFSDPNVAWGRVFFLSAVADAAGNRVEIGLLPNGRVETVTDALGKVTRLYYELSNPGIPPVGPGENAIANFDYTNQVTRIVDPFGRTALFQYEKTVRWITGICVGEGESYACPFSYYNYDLTNIVDMGGLSSRMAYDATGLVVTNLITPYGETKFKWVSAGAGDYAMEITNPEGETERIEYVPFGRGGIDPALWKRPQGMRTDGWGAMVAHWDKQAFAQSYRPDSYQGATIYVFQMSETLWSAGRVLMAIKKPLENPVWFNYPDQGAPVLPGIGDLPRLTGRVLDDGSTQLWRTERDLWGNLIQSTDPLGRTTYYDFAANRVDLTRISQKGPSGESQLLRVTWNDQHRPLTITDVGGGTTRFTYNARGQVTSVANALNEVITYTYDANGFLTGLDGPLPGTEDRNSFTYDAFGRLRTATDSDGYAVTMDYDAFDRATKFTFPDGTAQQLFYDRMELGKVRDRLGQETVFTRDGLRRLTAVQDALGRVTRFQWCGCGGLAGVVDPLGRLTQWHRDLQGRVIAKEFPDGSRIQYEYEMSTSRLRQKRDEQNQLTVYRYNLADELVSQSYLNARRPTPDVSFTYDPFYPRLTSMLDGEGLTLFQYYPVSGSPGSGQLSAVDGPWENDLVTFAYDSAGRQVARAIEGVVTRHFYDPAGRMTRMTNALGEFTFAFEGATERVSAIGYPNGQRSEFVYAGNVRDQLLQRATHFLPGGAKLSEFTYAYNARGLITNWTQFQSGRLKTWTPVYDAVYRLTNLVETVSGAAGTVASWAYDIADNRLLEQTGSQRREFAYNALNQLSGVSATSPLEPFACEWDAENRLVAISNATGRVEFGYDGLDRRTRVTVKNGTTVLSDRRYLWCGEQLCEERDASGSVVLKRYSSHGLLNVGAPELPRGPYYFTRDHIGSVREMVSASGVVSAFDYSAFGEQAQLSGVNRPDFGYTGFFQPAGVGNWLAVYRAYSPSLGQWLSRDPGGERGGLNLMAYAGGDPVNYFDRSGFEPGAAKLYSNTQGYKNAKAGMDAYDTAKKVGKVVDKVVEKGVKDTVKGELEDKAKDATPKGGMEEYKQLMDNADQIREGGVNPLTKAWKDTANGINQNLSGDCQPSKPKRPGGGKAKEAPKEKGVFDTFLDIIGLGDPPPPPPEPDGKIKIKPVVPQQWNPSAGY